MKALAPVPLRWNQNGAWIHILTRFLDANRCPLRWKTLWRPTKKARADPPGLLRRLILRSGRGLVELCRRSLDRLDRLGRDLLAELGEFLGLGRERLELLFG